MMSFGGTIFILILLGCLTVFAVGVYNGLVSLKNQVDRAWANIDVILKQRYDEIPQLIQVIEQFAHYESGILEKLAEARSHYGQARTVPDKIKASQEMSIALSGVMGIGEAYPEIKANQNFTQLQTRVSQLESTIADRRETYNDSVTNFNTRIAQFPDVLVANYLQYTNQDLYKVEEFEKVAPSLKMNLPKFGKGA